MHIIREEKINERKKCLPSIKRAQQSEEKKWRKMFSKCYQKNVFSLSLCFRLLFNGTQKVNEI
jgi:hypothetical protein